MKEVIKEIDVKFLERSKARVSFIEAYSNTNVTEYCMLDDNYEAIHPQIRCKDYLQDLFWAVKSEKNMKIAEGTVYGFTPAKYLKYPLINRDIYRVGIRFRTEGQEFKTFESGEVARILSKLEAILEFPTSNVFTTNKNKVMVFEFHPEWTKYLYLISFYLLAIRVLAAEKVEVLETLKENEDIVKYFLEYPANHSGGDAVSLKKGRFLIEKLFNREFPEQKWEYEELYDVHNTSGIASYSMLLEQINKRQTKKKDEVTIS